MRRWMPWVVVVAGVVTGAWVLLEGDAPAHGPGVTWRDDAGPTEAAGVGLRARTRVRAMPTALDPNRILGGVVLDARRKPLANVEVELRRWDEGKPSTHALPVVASAVTDADGRFGFTHAAARGAVDLRAYPAPPWATVARRVSAWEDDRDGIELVARPGHALHGQVLGLNGQPAQATVSAWMDDPVRGERGWQLSPQRTDAQGRFALGAVPAGVARFDVALAQGVTRRGMPVWVPARGPVVLDLTLKDPAAIEGTVRDAAGDPLAGATVSVRLADRPNGGLAWAARSTSAKDGTFRLAPLGPGFVTRAEIECPGFVALRGGMAGVEIGPGETKRFDVSLAPGATLTGRVVDRDGRPLGDVLVHVSGTDDAWEELSWTTQTGADGRYHVDGLIATWLNVRVFAQGYYVDRERTPSGHDTSLVIRPPGATVERNYVMAPGSPIHGTLRDPAGVPIAGVVLAAEDDAAIRADVGLAPVMSGRTDATGAFTFPGLDPTTSWDLSVASVGWRLAPSDSMHLEPETPSTMRLVAHPTGAIHGVVLDGDGQPVPAMLLRLAWRRALSDPDGRFAFPDVPAGDYQIEARHQGSTPVSVSLADGEVKEGLTIRVPALLPVAGSLATESGEPVPGMTLGVGRPSHDDGHGWRLSVRACERRRSHHFRGRAARPVRHRR